MTLARTNSQKLALAAYQRIQQRKPSREFASFAREFPALVHACGLAQAVAFAKAKKQHHAEYLEDLTFVLSVIGHSEAASVDALVSATCDQPVPRYVRLSRNALQAAGWLKRHVEAFKQE